MKTIARILKVTLLAFFVTTLALPVALRAQVQTDDFNDQDDTFPLEWAHYDPIGDFIAAPQNSWTYPGAGSEFGYTITATNSPDPGNVGPGRGASLLTNVVYDSFYISVDVIGWDTNKDSAFGILARIDTPGLGTTVGYSFTYQADDHDVQISKITGETPTDIGGTLKSITLDSTNRYRFVFQGKGTYFEARIYDIADLTTPLILVQGTDAAYASGSSGLVVYDNGSNGGTTGADATFDNFQASGAPQFVPCENPIVVSDDFNDANDTGWSRYMDPPLLNQTFNLTNSGYRLTSEAGTNANFSDYGRVASFRIDGSEVADFNVSVDLVDWDNGQSQQMGVLARLQTPLVTPVPSVTDFPACYALVYVNRQSSGNGGTDQLRIFKIGPGQLDFIRGFAGEIGGIGQFGVVTGGSPPPDPTNNYRLVFKGVGDLLMGQIIDLTTGLPMTFNDNFNKLTNAVWATDYQTNTNPRYIKGHFGVITFRNNAGAPDATFDNFCATQAAPPVSITPNGANVDISWSANQEGIWVLDSSPDLATWTEVPFSALTFASGNLSYSVTADGNSFFRLRRI